MNSLACGVSVQKGSNASGHGYDNVHRLLLYLGVPASMCTVTSSSCDQEARANDDPTPSQRHPIEEAHTERFLAADLARRVQSAQRTALLPDEASLYASWGRGSALTPPQSPKQEQPSKCQRLPTKTRVSNALSMARIRLPQVFSLKSTRPTDLSSSPPTTQTSSSDKTPARPSEQEGQVWGVKVVLAESSSSANLSRLGLTA